MSKTCIKCSKTAISTYCNVCDKLIHGLSHHLSKSIRAELGLEPPFTVRQRSEAIPHVLRVQDWPEIDPVKNDGSGYNGGLRLPGDILDAR